MIAVWLGPLVSALRAKIKLDKLRRKQAAYRKRHGIGGQRDGYTAALRGLEVGETVILPLTLSVAHARAAYALGPGNYRAKPTEGGFKVWRTA